MLERSSVAPAVHFPAFLLLACIYGSGNAWLGTLPPQHERHIHTGLCVVETHDATLLLQVDPVDAGTDNGFTFTAPNWPTEPQGLIYRVTSHYPAHPASSFYYPYMKRLPPIATFQFIKVRGWLYLGMCMGWVLHDLSSRNTAHVSPLQGHDISFFLINMLLHSI